MIGGIEIMSVTATERLARKTGRGFFPLFHFGALCADPRDLYHIKKHPLWTWRRASAYRRDENAGGPGRYGRRRLYRKTVRYGQ